MRACQIEFCIGRRLLSCRSGCLLRLSGDCLPLLWPSMVHHEDLCKRHVADVMHVRRFECVRVVTPAAGPFSTGIGYSRLT